MHNFFQLNQFQLKQLVNDLLLPDFVARQLREWIYKKFKLNPDDWKNISLKNRKLLKKNILFNTLSVEQMFRDEKDNTVKILFKTEDLLFFEGVLIEEKDHYTACLSTQIGCLLGCKFCATAQAGFKRNLYYYEILEQLVHLLTLKEDPLKRTNIVFMGMGEPLLNYGNLKPALEMILDREGFGVSPRHITVSTAGILKGIKQLERDFPKIKLAFSLNASNQTLREELMPVARTEKLSSILDYFQKVRRKNRITIEYVMLSGINDALKQAQELAFMLKKVDCKINLIPFNENPFSDFKQPALKDIESFQNYLISQKHTVNIRFSKGRNIASACGQLFARGKSDFKDDI